MRVLRGRPRCRLKDVEGCSRSAITTRLFKSKVSSSLLLSNDIGLNTRFCLPFSFDNSGRLVGVTSFGSFVYIPSGGVDIIEDVSPGCPCDSNDTSLFGRSRLLFTGASPPKLESKVSPLLIDRELEDPLPFPFEDGLGFAGDTLLCVFLNALSGLGDETETDARSLRGCAGFLVIGVASTSELAIRLKELSWLVVDSELMGCFFPPLPFKDSARTLRGRPVFLFTGPGISSLSELVTRLLQSKILFLLDVELEHAFFSFEGVRPLIGDVLFFLPPDDCIFP